MILIIFAHVRLFHLLTPLARSHCLLLDCQKYLLYHGWQKSRTDNLRQHIVLFSQLAKFDNELCKPRSTLVAIDKPSFKFFPYFVKLDRCGGSCNDIQPSIKSCVPLQYNEVSVSVKMVSTGETKIIKERNHTHCGCQCVITIDDCNLELEDWKQELCQCKCRFGDKPPTPCRDGFRWSKKDCRCICDKAPETCPSNKVWET